MSGALVFGEPLPLVKEPSRSSAGGPSAQRGPCSEAQWAPGSSLKNQVGCLGGRTDPCAFSRVRGPGWAGASLPRTALLPCQLLGTPGCPMETSLVHP